MTEVLQTITYEGDPALVFHTLQSVREQERSCFLTDRPVIFHRKQLQNSLDATIEASWFDRELAQHILGTFCSNLYHNHGGILNVSLAGWYKLVPNLQLLGQNDLRVHSAYWRKTLDGIVPLFDKVQQLPDYYEITGTTRLYSEEIRSTAERIAENVQFADKNYRGEIQDATYYVRFLEKNGFNQESQLIHEKVSMLLNNGLLNNSEAVLEAIQLLYGNDHIKQTQMLEALYHKPAGQNSEPPIDYLKKLAELYLHSHSVQDIVQLWESGQAPQVSYVTFKSCLAYALINDDSNLEQYFKKQAAKYYSTEWLNNRIDGANYMYIDAVIKKMREDTYKKCTLTPLQQKLLERSSIYTTSLLKSSLTSPHHTELHQYCKQLALLQLKRICLQPLQGKSLSMLDDILSAILYTQTH